MWIVRLALRRPYTFVVMAMLIAVMGAVSIYRMPTDIFPEINIPVVSVVWQFTGMPADEIEQRIILINERVLTTSVNDIEHIESQSLFGVGVIRIYFYPGAKIEAAVAQVTAAARDRSALHRAIQRDERADRADRRQQRHSFGAADLRLRRQLHHPTPGNGPGSTCAAALGRQVAAGDGRSRPGRALWPRSLARRRAERDQQPEPDHSGWNGQDRPNRVLREAQLEPRSGVGV